MDASLPRRRIGGTEETAWFFMRVSGLVMLFIAVGHLLYMHLVAGVEQIDYDWILQRWASPIWRFYDWLLLAFALGHGANGVRTVIDDYVPRGMARVAIRWALYVATFAFFVMGTQIIVSAPRP